MSNQISTSVYAGGHLYGFDDTILKCISAATGAEAWKVRGYGLGTLVRAGEMLVVLSDRGALALVRADPKAHQEVARAQVLEGKALLDRADPGRRTPVPARRPRGRLRRPDPGLRS